MSELEMVPAIGYASRMTDSILAQNIGALRRHLGKNQTEFADLIGTQQANVSKWESKGVEPTSDYLSAMAERAGVSIRQFKTELWRPETIKKPLKSNVSSITDWAEEQGWALVEEVDLALGMGATFLEPGYEPESRGLVPFKASWLRDIFRGPVAQLKVVRGSGDSMEPTIRDGDFVLLDTSKKRLDEQDVIWAVSYGDLGMIRRLRQLPGGGVSLMPDNQNVRPINAYDGEMHILGRVIWIGRRM
jgi:phage repressor protein C with HTH and peptisase S24 domain